MVLLRIVNSDDGNKKPSIISQIDNYAREKGLTKKAGAFFEDGKYYGSIYTVGREGGIDMLDYK